MVSFIGEMAAITQAIHYQKAIYLVPLRSLAEEKYRHFKKLYSGKDCLIKILISSRDHREDDYKIIAGEYEIAVMVYEKFNYFLWKYPALLENISLIIVDELQMIHDPERGPLKGNMEKRNSLKSKKIKTTLMKIASKIPSPILCKKMNLPCSFSPPGKRPENGPPGWQKR